MSADTDYISLYKHLKMLGKIVIVVAIQGQSLKFVKPEVDDFIFLDSKFFSSCISTLAFKHIFTIAISVTEIITAMSTGTIAIITSIDIPPR